MVFPEKEWNRYVELIGAAGGKPSDHLLVVDIAEQAMVHFEDFRAVARYRVSTARVGPSCIEGSNGTPTGWHEIARRIGDGQPAGMIFRARVPTGTTWDELVGPDREPNLITSRILWLRGLEEGVNAGPGVDTFNRYVYLHGTNHPDRIGSPSSGGCVQLRDADMIRLHDAVPERCAVLIRTGRAHGDLG